MTAKRILIAYAAITLIGVLLLLSIENAYIVIAILCILLLLGVRIFWSLLRHRRMPVMDERVRDNIVHATKATGVFFIVASVVLILLLGFDVFEHTPKVQIIAGELLIVGLVYVISYCYYDRVRPNLGQRALRWLKRCLIGAGLSLSTSAMAIVLHNLVSMWMGTEDAAFFILGLLVAPACFLLCLLASLIIYFKGLWASFKSVNTI